MVPGAHVVGLVRYVSISHHNQSHRLSSMHVPGTATHSGIQYTYMHACARTHTHTHTHTSLCRIPTSLANSTTSLGVCVRAISISDGTGSSGASGRYRMDQRELWRRQGHTIKQTSTTTPTSQDQPTGHHSTPQSVESYLNQLIKLTSFHQTSFYKELLLMSIYISSGTNK